LFERALALAPHDGAVLLGRAAAQLNDGQIEQAIADLDLQLRQHPGWLAGHGSLCRLRWLSGEREQFAASFERAVAAAPREIAIWREWADPRLTVMVLNNADLNMVTWEERIEGGDPRFAGSQSLPDFPYAEYARMLGLHAIRVERPEDVGPAWDEALAADRPCMLDMKADPNVPPLPPHVTAKQVKAYMSALLKGDSSALATVMASAKEAWEGMFPPSEKETA